MKQTRSWDIRMASVADDAGLGELFRVVVGFDRGTEHHRWKFHHNLDGAPVIVVAEHQGRIVGQYALWPTRLRLGNEVVLGAQSLDTMTHPDYRGQGMFTVLAEECMRRAAERGIEALYGFPNENSRPGFVRKLDWDCTGDIPIWVRPLTISKHRRVPSWAGPLANVAVRFLPSGRLGALEERAEMPTYIAQQELIDRWREQQGLCRVERSQERFAWRFSAASGMQYRWVCAYQGEKLLAMGVWGTDIRNGNAVLSELLSIDAFSAEAVLSTIIQNAAACPLILAVSSRTELVSTLRRCGFVRHGNFPLIVRKLTARSLGANVHTHSNWEVFGADLDTF